MLRLLAASPSYEKDMTAQTVWGWINEIFTDAEGVCYYKYPAIRTLTGSIPDLSALVRTHQPFIVRCLPLRISDIDTIEGDIWVVEDSIRDSPMLELEDFIFKLGGKLNEHRDLRYKLTPFGVLALPLISKSEFDNKFGSLEFPGVILWATQDKNDLARPLDSALTDIEWRLSRAVFQGVTSLIKSTSRVPIDTNTLGEAIKKLDREISVLDEEQEEATIQVAPGPQRIRGLAGTGKTVLLARKAANIHQYYPDAKILFTFHTHSLYNQTEMLISRFYRHFGDSEPNWDLLHVRHSWGGRKRPGVYSEICGRQGVSPITFGEIKNQPDPFRTCCRHALSNLITPEYDFILVDEAQDFPAEFFQILYKLSSDPHRICWAYDELQSLFSLDIPGPEELFGKDDKGEPLVTFNGADYPSDIPKDYVLHKSYRCSQPVLMLAHAIGLGMYNQNGGPVQMLENKASWEALGYKVTQGNLKFGETVEIHRPPENSPNPIEDIYTGKEQLIVHKVFEKREDELDWIARAINHDIREEAIAPEHVVVISLDSPRAKNYLLGLQSRLTEYNIASTIPGLIDDSAAFAEPGFVTLSTIARAKGNEAYAVYILSFESLYDYVEAVGNRNAAFTAISRSKAWVRISGVGKRMEMASEEINLILADQPYFRFAFPNMADIRRLDTETNRRRQIVAKAKDSVKGLTDLDPAVLAALDPNLLEKLRKQIEEAKRENQ